MLRADRRVVVSHVGSLVRPPAMVPYLEKIRDKEPYDEAAFEKCLTDSVAEAVRLQAEAVSSRRAPTNSYETYCGDRDSGRRSVMSLAASQGVWSAITLVRPR